MTGGGATEVQLFRLRTGDVSLLPKRLILHRAYPYPAAALTARQRAATEVAAAQSHSRPARSTLLDASAAPRAPRSRSKRTTSPSPRSPPPPHTRTRTAAQERRPPSRSRRCSPSLSVLSLETLPWVKGRRIPAPSTCPSVVDPARLGWPPSSRTTRRREDRAACEGARSRTSWGRGRSIRTHVEGGSNEGR